MANRTVHTAQGVRLATNEEEKIFRSRDDISVLELGQLLVNKGVITQQDLDGAKTLVASP